MAGVAGAAGALCLPSSAGVLLRSGTLVLRAHVTGYKYATVSTIPTKP